MANTSLESLRTSYSVRPDEHTIYSKNSLSKFVTTLVNKRKNYYPLLLEKLALFYPAIFEIKHLMSDNISALYASLILFLLHDID